MKDEYYIIWFNIAGARIIVDMYVSELSKLIMINTK